MTIGIIRRNGLGDVICSLPLMYLCQRQMPSAKTILFIDENAKALAPYLEGPNKIITIPSGGYWGLVRLAWAQRRFQFDLLISAKPTPMKMVNFLMRLLRSKRRIATVVSRKDPFTHQALKTLQLLDPTLKEIPEDLRPRLKMPPLQKFTAGPVLFISVTNNRLGSTLDLDKYARILSAVKKPFYVVINGEPKDLAPAEKLSCMLQVPHEIRLTDSFDDFMSLIASADAFLIGDGGIMHIAAAYNKPQVVLFGGTKISEWAPLSDRAKCLGDPHNVNFIPEADIIQALEEIL
ncbi:MAG: glycosyltransferase family 9 protein [Verrucomicrobia bacterium]|nr:glycosyltransferase family 9 protein [Verrucomicrobiota bacterium]